MPSRPGPSMFRLLCAAMLFAEAALAQDYALRVWETDDGLSHNGVNAVAHGNDGFLWLATQNGINRFDGHSFRKIHSPLLANMRTAPIRAVIQHDPRTLLAAHDEAGILVLENGRLSLHPLSSRIPAGERVVKLLREDDGVFWVALASRALWRCAAGQVQEFPAPQDVDTFLPITIAKNGRGEVFVARGVGVERFTGAELVLVPAIGNSIAVVGNSRDGHVWVATTTGLGKLAGDAARAVECNPEWPLNAQPMHLLEDRSGALWIGTKGNGILRFANGELAAIPASYPRINQLLEDREGNIWAASAGGGLNRIQPARFAFFGESGGVLPDIVGSVCEDASGQIWFGNRNCFGRLQAGRLELPAIMETFARKVVPLCSDREGTLWFAVASRLGKLKPASAEAPAWVDIPDIGPIHVIHSAGDGGVWIGGETGPLLCLVDGVARPYSASAGFTGSGAQAIAETPAGELWFGTQQGEIYRFTGGRFTRFGAEAGLPQTPVRAIHADTAGNVIVGTAGRGAFVWDGRLFLPVNEQNGLPDDTISQLIEDDFGVLWFGSSRGLFKVPKQEVIDCARGKTARVLPVRFGKADGLAGFSATANYQPSTWKSRDGRLWFATRKGLVTTRPERHSSAQPSSKVHIESFNADGRSLDPGSTALRSSARKFEVRYTAPTFTSPEKVQFRHRLDGLDTDWTEVGEQRMITYSQLPPGRYKLRLMASNRDLLWNSDETVLAFEVLPQWWQTWWARGTAAALGIAIVGWGARAWSHRRLRARVAELEARRRLEAERARIARDLHDSLGASLTQAGMLADEISEDGLSQREVREYSSELGNRVRAIARDLDAAVWAVSPKNDTLASLSAYLSQFALEFFRQSSTRCRVQIADDIPSVPLSPESRHHLFLTAREAMNNVLKHAGAMEVQLTASITGVMFTLTIADNGHGFDVESARSRGRNGQRNMQARIEEIGGQLEITSSNSGTVVTITLPLPACAGTPNPVSLVVPCRSL